jgi:Branched-chain amino acid ATP-binding cassette transporter
MGIPRVPLVSVDIRDPSEGLAVTQAPFRRSGAEGTPAAIQADPRVTEAYIGAPEPADSEAADEHMADEAALSPRAAAVDGGGGFVRVGHGS